MTRLQRKRRRQWIAVYLILAAVILALAAVIVWVNPWEQEEVERVPYNPPACTIAEVKAEIAMRTDYPKHYYRQDIPELDRYQQETLYNAAKEWNVPYELALAVCWRETQYQNLVTPVPQEDGTVLHYYGMMAVQIESAGSYMEKCGVDYLNSEEDRLRVGCCILGEHIRNYGITRGLMAYNAGPSGAAEQWALGVYYTNYTMDVLNKMEELMK